MRRTTLPDLLDHGGSGPWRPAPERSAAAPLQGPAAPDAFDRLVADLLPCRRYDAELWFAESTADVERAKALCGDCPARQACLAGAIERAEPWGVWGGEVFVGGVVVPRKRGRGRPPKNPSHPAA